MNSGMSGNGRTRRAAQLARAEQMHKEVFTEPGEGRALSKAGLTRRVMFSVAGVTLLGGCGVVSAANAGKTGGASPLATTAGPSPTDFSTPPPDTAPPTGAATPSDPATSKNGFAVQTRPQYYVEGGPKVIALTLDDGPSQYTSQILDILAQYKITATFCMIGRQIAGNAGIVREVASAGHHITNHTWDHADQTKLSLSACTAEIHRTNEALSNVGITPTMYRAPFGSWSPTVFEAAANAGLRSLAWSVDPRDWSMPGVNKIVANIMEHTSTGSIILDHDGGGNRSQTVAAMRIWLPRLLADGYRFTTP